MKFSIIIPVHNGESTIVKCVESFVKQKYSELEIILVNDHSVDRTINICQELQNKYKEIKYYVSEEKGVSAARNVGLKHVTGDIIGFCDADDTTVDNSLQMIEALFCQNSDVDIVVGGYNVVYQSKTKYRGYHKVKIWSAYKLMCHVIEDNRVLGSVWNKFFKKEIIKDVKFDEMLPYCEDTHFLVRVLTQNRQANIFMYDVAVYNYFVNETSVTRSGEKVFDANNQLKYLNSMNAIIRDCELTLYPYCLVRRKKYILAMEVLVNFGEKNEQRKNLLINIRKNILFFVLLIPTRFKESVRHVVYVLVKGIIKLKKRN